MKRHRIAIIPGNAMAIMMPDPCSAGTASFEVVVGPVVVIFSATVPSVPVPFSPPKEHVAPLGKPLHASVTALLVNPDKFSDVLADAPAAMEMLAGVVEIAALEGGVFGACVMPG